MKVKTIKEHRYGSQKRSPGDVYEAAERQAIQLVKTGHVVLVDPRDSRDYKRRDMKAED